MKSGSDKSTCRNYAVCWLSIATSEKRCSCYFCYSALARYRMFSVDLMTPQSPFRRRYLSYALVVKRSTADPSPTHNALLTLIFSLVEHTLAKFLV